MALQSSRVYMPALAAFIFVIFFLLFERTFVRCKERLSEKEVSALLAVHEIVRSQHSFGMANIRLSEGVVKTYPIFSDIAELLKRPGGETISFYMTESDYEYKIDVIKCKFGNTDEAFPVGYSLNATPKSNKAGMLHYYASETGYIYYRKGELPTEKDVRAKTYFLSAIE